MYIVAIDAKNVIIFGVNNSSSSHDDNLKNNFLVLGEGDTFGINGILVLVLVSILVHQKKTFSVNFSIANTNFCLSLHYNADNSYFFVTGKEIFKFKIDNKSNTVLPRKYF